MCETNLSVQNYISACFTEFSVGKEFSQKRVHGTIEKEPAELATRNACITYGAAAKLHQVMWLSILEVHASRRSRSVKSSQYNRKRVGRSCHSQCMHHIGCSNEAAPGMGWNIMLVVLHSY